MSRRRGRVVLHLDPDEIDLLGALFADLDTALEALDPDDPVTRRLFPAGYADEQDAAEFRALTESTLRSERSARLQACLADLALGPDVELTGGDRAGDPGHGGDAATRWIQSLNDLRLALGTRLDVREDIEHDVDPTDPADRPWLVYHWLTAVQDRVVSRLMP